MSGPLLAERFDWLGNDDLMSHIPTHATNFNGKRFTAPARLHMFGEHRHPPWQMIFYSKDGQIPLRIEAKEEGLFAWSIGTDAQPLAIKPKSGAFDLTCRVNDTRGELCFNGECGSWTHNLASMPIESMEVRSEYLIIFSLEIEENGEPMVHYDGDFLRSLYASLSLN